MHSICSVWSYFAVAMILWHDPALRAKHARACDGMTTAWKATYHHDLTAHWFGEVAWRRIARLQQGRICLAVRHDPLPEIRPGQAAVFASPPPTSCGCPAASAGRELEPCSMWFSEGPTSPRCLDEAPQLRWVLSRASRFAFYNYIFNSLYDTIIYIKRIVLHISFICKKWSQFHSWYTASIRDADILLEHSTETPEFNANAVTLLLHMLTVDWNT